MHLSATTSQLCMIPEGAAGIAATLKLMTQLVKECKKSMTIRELAIALSSPYAQKDWTSEVEACRLYVRDCIRYIGDITDVETIQYPEKTLELGAGDCDDKSTLLATMLESIGHPTRFVAIGFQSGVYEHVYVETLIGQDWVPLETTENVEMGWVPPMRIAARMVRHN